MRMRKCASIASRTVEDGTVGGRPFTHLDANTNQPPDHVLLGPAAKPPLSPQALVLHNSHPQNREPLAILLTLSDELKAVLPRRHWVILPAS